MNTNEHKWNTSEHKWNTNEHKWNTNEHKWNTNEHKWTQVEHKCWCKKREQFFKFQEFIPKLLRFSKRNSKRNIFSAEKSGKYEGHFTHSIKRTTISVQKDSYDLSWIFVDNKRSLPKRRNLGVRVYCINRKFTPPSVIHQKRCTAISSGYLKFA